MSVVNWGLLAKSQDDDETIEEAIGRLIAEHEADPDSHLGAGESLQSHRASEIIDHVAKSVLPDKLRFQIFSLSLIDNGFYKECSDGNYITSFLLDNNFSIHSLNDENLCFLFARLGELVSDWDNDEIYFETIARASTGAGYSEKWKVGFGDYDIYNFGGREESWPGIGFYFDHATLKIYAFYIDSGGNLQTHEVVSSYTLQFYKFNIELVSGVLKFYVNDVLEWTVGSPTFYSLPKNTSVLFAGTDYRYDSGTGNPTFNVKYISFSQPNPY